MPSPIGLKDRGDYRRDGLDVLTSNGMLYVCAGIFTGCETDNTTDKKRTEGGIIDPSVSRLILPRFYNSTKITSTAVTGAPVDDGNRIYMAPGDRVYVSDPAANVLVSNYQKMTYEEGHNVPLFPIVQMEVPISYVQGLDFNVSSEGAICWLSGGKNPGFDPETGKGRVYSIRYLYKAFHYVTSIPKEVRMANITESGVRKPERLAYYVVLQREYIYHSQTRGEPKNQSQSPTPDRAVQEPLDNRKPAPGAISVDMVSFIEDGLPDGET